MAEIIEVMTEEPVEVEITEQEAADKLNEFGVQCEAGGAVEVIRKIMRWIGSLGEKQA